MTNQPIRVVMVDDHEVLRCGLVQLFATEPDIQVVGEGATGLEAIHLCDELQPDVLLLDLQMPIMDGLTAARVIRTSQPQIRIVILTSFITTSEIKAALQMGVMGYMAKDISAATFIMAMRTIHAGEQVLGQPVLNALVDNLQHPPAPDYYLTSREQEVARLVIQGLSNKQIAAQLYLALPTVKRHVSAVLHKANLSSRTALVAAATKCNWVSSKRC